MTPIKNDTDCSARKGTDFAKAINEATDNIANMQILKLCRIGIRMTM